MKIKKIAGRYIDNQHLPHKLRVRREVAEWFPEGAVLDCYSGEGEMARRAWSDRRVVRIDKKDLPGVDHVGNNRRLAPTLAATGQFRVFDLDAYGSPWLLLRDICAALPDGRYGFAVTCGLERNLCTKSMANWLPDAIGLPTRVSINLRPFYRRIVGILSHASGNCKPLQIRYLKAPTRGISVTYYAMEVQVGGAPTMNNEGGHDGAGDTDRVDGSHVQPVDGMPQG